MESGGGWRGAQRPALRGQVNRASRKLVGECAVEGGGCFGGGVVMGVDVVVVVVLVVGVAVLLAVWCGCWWCW